MSGAAAARWSFRAGTAGEARTISTSCAAEVLLREERRVGLDAVGGAGGHELRSLDAVGSGDDPRAHECPSQFAIGVRRQRCAELAERDRCR